MTLALPAAVSLSLSLSGCGGGDVACNAVGYSNLLSVEVKSDLPIGSVVIDLPDEDADLTQSERQTYYGSGPMEHAADGTWQSSLNVVVPATVTLQVLDPVGATIAETEVHPEWIRVGGTEQCGGPHEATVEIHVP